jgi:hypothetical protein
MHPAYLPPSVEFLWKTAKSPIKLIGWSSFGIWVSPPSPGWKLNSKRQLLSRFQ